MKDWRFHVAKMELGLRTDAIIMTRMNGTTAWVEQQIEELGEEEFDKWFDIVVSTAFTEACESEYKKMHTQENDIMKAKRRVKIAADQQKKDNAEALLTLENEEEYDAQNVEANFADLASMTKTEACQKAMRQWQRLKLIATASKIPARQQGWPNQPPEKSTLAKWKEKFIVLLTDARLMAILEKGKTNLQKRLGVRRGALGEVLTAIERKEGVGQEILDEYKRKCDLATNKNSDRSKRMRLAATNNQDDQGEGGAEEAEQTRRMEAGWHLSALQEVNA